MNILGVNISHDPAICFYKNGRVYEFYNEDRFINVKNDEFHADLQIMQSIQQKVKSKPDFVCYASYGRNQAYTRINDYQIINKIQHQLGHPKYYFTEREHHLYHACSAFYFSGFDEAAAIVVDGGGAACHEVSYSEMESIYFMNKKTVYPIYKHSSNRRIDMIMNRENQLTELFKYQGGYLNYFSNRAIGGHTFSMAAQKIGYKSGHDSGKVMGLSSYAYAKERYENLNYDKVKIAQEAQEVTFKETCELIDNAKNLSRNIVLSGGYFLNCSNNFKYVKKYPEVNFFVDPIPHDAGTAVGVAVYYDNYKN
jgi:carbamoyltransferase